jgi:hypothetical protein
VDGAVAKTYPTSNGDKCASQYECDVVQSLIDRGLPYEYEPVKLEYETNIVKGLCKQCGAEGRDVVQRRTYTPDLRLPNGIIVEVKGKFTAPKRNLMRQLVKSNPDIDLRFIFMRDNFYGGRKGTRRRYTGWAHTQGCVAVVGTEIPAEWFNE